MTSSSREVDETEFFVPSHFGARTPAVDGTGSFLGIAAEEDLKELGAGVLRGNATANVASADVILANPEEDEMDSCGHDVVVLDAAAEGRAHPLKSFDDELAVGEAGGGGSDSKKGDEKKEEQATVEGGPHAERTLVKRRRMRSCIIWR